MSTIMRKRKGMTKPLREVSAALTIMAREIVLTVRSPQRVFIALAWPILMLGMLGNQLSQNMGINMGYDFTRFMVIGMMVNALFMMTTQGIISLVEDRENDFTQEIMVSPVSRYSILLGKILGASFTGYIQMLVTIIIGYMIGVSLTAGQIIAMLAVSPLICLAAGAFGMCFIGFIRDTKTAGLVGALITMLQTFLCGALIPVNQSSGFMLIFNRLLPMTYCLDFVRGLFYAGTPEYDAIVIFTPGFNLLIITLYTVAFFIIGTICFVRSEVN